jgi:hypothetical protein
MQIVECLHSEVPSMVKAKKFSFLASTFQSHCNSLNLVHNRYTFEALLQTLSLVPHMQSISVPQRTPSTLRSYSLPSLEEFLLLQTMCCGMVLDHSVLPPYALFAGFRSSKANT